MIVRVNVVLNRTVVDSDCRFDNLCLSHLQIFRVKVSCITSTDGIPLTLVISLKIGQLRKSQCYWSSDQ